MNKEINGHKICSKANLREANLLEANLRKADLRYADLREANLRYANLCKADLRYANLWKADLWKANLLKANLQEANLLEADLRYADLRYADLQEANLRYADLREANLREADLRYANLRYANLWKADLQEADLLISFFPSIGLVSQINFYDLPDELALELMRRDCYAHPTPKLFDDWALGGNCPYSSLIERNWFFCEKKELWKPGNPTMRDSDLIIALFEAKGWGIKGFTKEA